MITAGVPTISAGADVPLAEQTAVSQLLTALDVVVHPGAGTDQVAETLLLGAIGDADAMYLRRLRRELHRQARAAGEPLDADLIAPLLSDLVGIEVLPARLRGPLIRVANVLSAGRVLYAQHASAEDVLWAMWEASGLAAVWERRSANGGPGGAAADRDLDAVIDLFAAAARLADRLPGATAEALYDHVLAQQLPGDVWTRSAPTGEGVQILTAHASKGLEWEVVCVAAVQEGTWPDLRRRGSVLGSEFLVDVVANRAEVSNQSLQPLLEEERRLFYVATTRARKRLYITAVTGDDEQPSRFLDEIDPIEGDRPVHIPTRGLHLSDLVADLRTAVTDPARSPSVRAQAAELLARLADARVPGADPDQWWGLAELSDERGLIDAETLARVSPSQIDSYIKCALRTMLDGAGAREESTPKAELGSAIHEIAELAEAAADLDLLEEMMNERWPGLDFGAPWYARLQRKKATQMLKRLSSWLSASRKDLALVGQELAFSVEIDGARLGGKVDRVERDADGRLIVVDFKTGGTAATSAELPQHPQLGAYQLAVLLGAFGAEESSRSGGARLVQLGISRKDPEQSQPPMLDLDDAEWIRGLVGDVARLQRGHRFDAKVNQYCQVCAVKRLCPAQHGRQVTQP
jgi:RecB family exonuclease